MEDFAVPLAGQAFLYLITTEDTSGKQGTLGFAAGAEPLRVVFQLELVERVEQQFERSVRLGSMLRAKPDQDDPTLPDLDLHRCGALFQQLATL